MVEQRPQQHRRRDRRRQQRDDGPRPPRRRRAASSTPRNTTRAMPNPEAQTPSRDRQRDPAAQTPRQLPQAAVEIHVSAISLRRCPEPFRLQRARVGDIDRQMLGRLRRGGHQADALGASKRCHAPCGTTTSIPALSSCVCGSSSMMMCSLVVALDDLHQLVAVRVPLPGAIAGKFRGEDVAVAERRQRREGAARARARPPACRAGGRAAW